MCHGDLDPKYLMREMEARVKGVAAPQDERNTEPVPGLAGWAAALLARFRQKEATHV